MPGAPVDLLERDIALGELDAALGEAARGEGRVALVSGEAGIGKTALVKRFARVQRATGRVLWGGCDALFTPRPLGPLHDIAAQVGGTLPALLTGTADRAAVFATVLAEFHGRPVIAVFEDVHWADEATLDLLRFLGRRIARSPAWYLVNGSLMVALPDILIIEDQEFIVLPLDGWEGPATAARLAGRHTCDGDDCYPRPGRPPLMLPAHRAGMGLDGRR